MLFVLGVVISLVLGYLLWFIGHIVRKQLAIKEDNELLSNLINVALGLSIFLIVINLVGNLIKDFNWALIITLILILTVVIWKLKDFLEVTLSLVGFFAQNKITTFLKQYTDRYFWILLGVINFVYGVTAFSTTKLDRFNLPNGHVFNINQLLNGNYPLKYSFSPNIAQKYHYGSDVLGAVLSKFSGIHPEISLDILLLIFLNLSILTLYVLTIKFLNTNPINKYMVPFSAFLAWGPITNLFIKNPNETIPTNFLEKIAYLSQSRLNDAAQWTGLVLHWYFAPPIGIGIFFFLIALYLLFRFFEGERNLKYVILLGIYLSSFVIIDFSKFVIIIFGLLVYAFFNPIPLLDGLDEQQMLRFKWVMKNLGIILLISFLFGFIHGNCLKYGSEYTSFISVYNLGTNSIDKRFGPFSSNLVFLLISAFGFYLAYKDKVNWVLFLLSFFLSCFFIAHFISLPGVGVGKVLMSSNIIISFTIPIIISYFHKELLRFQPQKALTALFFILIFGFSTLMYFVFGGIDKLIFSFDGKVLKYSGIQDLKLQESFREEAGSILYLKKHGIKKQTIVTEPKFNEVFCTNTGLFNLLPIDNLFEQPLSKDVLSYYSPLPYYFDSHYLNAFSFNTNVWRSQNIGWFYLTHLVFRYLSPQARLRFLNTYLNDGAKLVYSNNRYDDLFQTRELYELKPNLISETLDKEFPSKSVKFLSNQNLPFYIKRMLQSCFYGIYNFMSNDFNGDKYADIAFFDESNKKWVIVSGKDGQETVIDLSLQLLKDYKAQGLLIPVPSDYDGDSITDIALFNRSNGSWLILRSSDSLIETIRKAGQSWSEIPLVADVDGDGKADNSCHNFLDKRWPTLLSTTGYGYSSRSFETTHINTSLYSDVDGDKKADYVVFTGGENKFQIYLSSKEYQPTTLFLGDSEGVIVLDDFDGDGKSDVSVWGPLSGKWEISYAKDFLKEQIINTQGEQKLLVGCGARPGSDQNSNVNVSSCVTKTYTIGHPGDIPMPGDYNGDGSSDIAIYHVDKSALEIIFSEGASKTIDLAKYAGFFPANFIGI